MPGVMDAWMPRIKSSIREREREISPMLCMQFVCKLLNAGISVLTLLYSQVSTLCGLMHMLACVMCGEQGYMTPAGGGVTLWHIYP